MVGLSIDSWFINNRREGTQRRKETKSLSTKISEEWERQIELTKYATVWKKLLLEHKRV